MATVEDKMVDKLLATAAVTNLIGTRLAPYGGGGQKVTLPYVAYERVSMEPYNAGDGPGVTEHARITVQSYGASHAAARALGEVVRAALGNWSEVTTFPKVTSCHCIMDVADFVEPFDGSEIGVFRVTQDYSLWYSTA